MDAIKRNYKIGFYDEELNSSPLLPRDVFSAPPPSGGMGDGIQISIEDRAFIWESLGFYWEIRIVNYSVLLDAEGSSWIQTNLNLFGVAGCKRIVTYFVWDPEE
ncbi:hypothetical protein CEXT_535651 [Caerostris extrusa]|uniref:Uncharacterized protein n=1 Tax=Caerostris extrusa TaxID=172846 RepID=A0AAV4XDA3_CAEEX|nr:hypothetical protein CEXT_535651 [Caerostris extrusa]